MLVGQAVVQFVLDRQHRSEYAVKFFLDREAFLTEAALYAACFPALHTTTSPAIAARAYTAREYLSGGMTGAGTMAAARRFLPQVEAVFDKLASGLEDPQGHLLPPCIVMERGELLQDWSDRAEPDLFTCLAVRIGEDSTIPTVVVHVESSQGTAATQRSSLQVHAMSTWVAVA